MAIASFSTAAVAHHSAAQFDFAQTVRIEGVVKEMRVANPHIALFLEVTDGTGTRVIEYEGHSRKTSIAEGASEMVHTGTRSYDIADANREDGGCRQDLRSEGRHGVLAPSSGLVRASPLASVSAFSCRRDRTG
jgi:hypothetical protein